MKLTKWKVQHFDYATTNENEIASDIYCKDHFWMNIDVPGDIHANLVQKKIIDDPFWGHNDQKCRWVEEKQWWYKTEFVYNEKIEDNEIVEITFEGLDTFATIFVNGYEIASTNNMFMKYTFDITRVLKVNEKNVIAVKFDSINKMVGDKSKKLLADYDRSKVWARKAQMNFGWDWGPRLVTVGIWKDVYIKKQKVAKIDSVFFKTNSIKDNVASVYTNIELKTLALIEDSLQYVITLFDNGKIINEECGQVEHNTINVTSEINNPKLWWTHDLGKPNLYKLEVKIFYNNEEIACETEEVGIRIIELITKEDNEHKFMFRLNGVDIFAKGANWIPVDSFIGAAQDSRYKHLLGLAVESNMNMIRVWGGGIYEKDVFYNLCNQLGLLVWQDFMFACSLYPDFNANFMENVEKEIESVIKRLRNHPSIALWNGNNEIDWIYDQKTSAGVVDYPYFGKTIFHQLIPDKLSKLDGTRKYWPSSPFGGNNHNSEDEGNRHNWVAWHGNVEPKQFGEAPETDYSVEGVSFKNYKKDYTKFSSEFGLHSSSNPYTLKKYIPDGEFKWQSDEMEYRNKDFHKPKGMLLMKGYTGLPQSLDQYIQYSMITQAEGLKCGIEHYRRNKVTKGTLIWQLNDCWPGTSWSLVDYELLPKASYYYAKKFYQPILLSADINGNNVKFHITNDTPKEIIDTFSIRVISQDGKILENISREIVIEKYTSRELLEFDFNNKPYNLDEVLIHVFLKNNLVENTYFLRDVKDLKLGKADVSYKIDYEKNVIKLKSKKTAYFVTFDIPQGKTIFSDNYMTLLPDREYEVEVKHLEESKIKLENLSISWYNM